MKTFEEFYNQFKESNPDFEITKSNEKTIIKVLKHLTSSKKGIYLYGDYGVGKTHLFKSIITFFKDVRIMMPIIISTDLYIHKSLTNQDIYAEAYPERTWIVDEFASECESNLKYYGAPVQELINNMMIRRYELFQNKGIRTHIATNLNPKDLPKAYGERLSDRFTEMFNFIHMDGKSMRK